MFIMVDGIDGSGKSTIINAMKEYLGQEGNAIFDLKNYWQENGCYPELSEIKAYDFIFSCEPTYIGVGQTIRNELIKNNNNYSARAIAEAYSLDRLVLYNKIIIPLIKQKKCVIQDRGVSSSLAYQTAQNNKLTFKIIKNMTGNQLALNFHPDHLIIADTKPETAFKRLCQRKNKQDDAVFEKLEFLKKITKQFKSEKYKKIFLQKGTKIHYLQGDVEIDIMKLGAVNLLKKIIKN